MCQERPYFGLSRDPRDQGGTMALVSTSPASRSTAPTGPVATTPAGLRLPLLVALVVGSMIGSGIFALPQNTAAGAGAGAILLGWLVSGVGMLCLAFVYQTLASRQPALDNGVYAYARASAGDYVGFNAAWGYWVSAWIGNVGYLVILFGSLGHFFPAFGEGNTTAAIVGASVLLWVMHFMILRGVHGAAVLNAITTVAKVVPLLVFLVFALLAFQAPVFTADFWGKPALGTVLEQVKSTMLVTVWAFIGIEGASVVSGRAQSRADVGRATLVGFAIVLVLLMGVSLLSLGILSQPELAALKNPSMAGLLEKIAGPWGGSFITIALLISVGGALLAWTLLAAETLFSPARDDVMPRALARQNKHGVPAAALWVTNGLVQVFLMLTLVANATYLALISLATSMILVPYLFSALHAVLSSSAGTGYRGDESGLRTRDGLLAGLATAYCLWLLYAAGLKYLLLSALLYAPGVLLFIAARREKHLVWFKGFEWVVLVGLVVLAVGAGWALANGTIKL
jgi:arginine:ornithine antiporter/lysine permease